MSITDFGTITVDEADALINAHTDHYKMLEMIMYNATAQAMGNSNKFTSIFPTENTGNTDNTNNNINNIEERRRVANILLQQIGGV